MDWKRCEETWTFPKVEAADNLKIETDDLPQKEEIEISSILKPNSNDVREFVCGWGSAVINITVTYPINKIIFRQVKYFTINEINKNYYLNLHIFYLVSNNLF